MKFVLNENHRNITDDALLQDVQTVARNLGKNSLTVEEYSIYGKYNPTTLHRRFGSWKNTLLLAGLDIDQHNFQISNDEYIADVRRVAELLKKDTVTNTEYREHGKYSASKLSKRFGSWKDVLDSSGLRPTGYNVSISDSELLEEIERIWIVLGRQPTTNDIKNGISRYGLTTYLRHFGSWRKALDAFVLYINAENVSPGQDVASVMPEKTKTVIGKHKTNRDVNLRLRYLVMQRDNFKCRICGATPATNPMVKLHIDHIVPWSKGGETTFDNLQTLCSNCNLGKSDIL